MKKLILLCLLLVGFNSFGQVERQSLDSVLNSLCLKLKPDIETIEVSKDVMVVRDLIKDVQDNLGQYSARNPTEYLRQLNMAVLRFNEKYSGKSIKGIEISKLKTYKLKLIQNDTAPN